jgi:hypothetical protein
MTARGHLSVRDPRVLRGFVLCAALGLAAGLGLELNVRHMLRDFAWLPSEVAALRAAAWLTGLALFVGGVCLILASTFLQAFRRVIAAQRSAGAARITTRTAVWLGRIGMGLALALGGAGLALGGYSAWLARSVVACAAKNL